MALSHSDPASAPQPSPDLLQRYRGYTRVLVWHHASDTATYRLEGPAGDALYLKLNRLQCTPPLSAEADRMRWARPFLPVPEVLETGSDASFRWLVTRALPGRAATDSALGLERVALVRTLAEGLRRFHEAPAGLCPFDFRLDTALDLARRRLEAGRIVPERDFHTEFAHLAARDAVRELERLRPSEDDPVVCHGDYCLPNALIEGGRVTGFVDLGELGVADRWWDLAVATWSVTWNLGPGLEGLFLEAYGVPADPERQRYYRLLYDVVS